MLTHAKLDSIVWKIQLFRIVFVFDFDARLPGLLYVLYRNDMRTHYEP